MPHGENRQAVEHLVREVLKLVWDHAAGTAGDSPLPGGTALNNNMLSAEMSHTARERSIN
ncbi:MAG TPA: hypothetical protein VGG06_27850 [Thermoanaerobaculia bacterium]